MDRKVIAFVAALSAAAAAESPPPRDPGDPRATVQPVRYESAFSGYRTSREIEVAPWKKANEEVAGAGMMGAHGAASAKPAGPKAGEPKTTGPKATGSTAPAAPARRQP